MSTVEQDDDESEFKSVTLKSEKGQAIVKEAIERASKTPAAREAFKRDPKAALLAVAHERKLELLIHGLQFNVVENTEHERFLVLPYDGDLVGKAVAAKPPG